MIEIRPREAVILAADYQALVAWYRDQLGFRVLQEFQDDFHYANLESAGGVRIGIAAADEMGVTPGDRNRNTVVLQFQVDDVASFFKQVAESGGTILNGPAFDAKGGFWFGSFADPEGNPCWVVDANCP